MISDHKAIYNLFGSGIYHKPHSIFKSKSYEFQNRNIGLFSGNYTRMAGYFIGIHRYLRMRKSLLATVSSAEFRTMTLNSKLSKVVSNIQDKKSWENIYVLSCSSPRWDNLPSEHQRYPLFGLNLGYMYWGQKHFSE